MKSDNKNKTKKMMKSTSVITQHTCILYAHSPTQPQSLNVSRQLLTLQAYCHGRMLYQSKVGKKKKKQ